ncbi:MAG: GNAT family N-acetyltransferase [Candidatus Izemoplasmataceae bacterium]
MNETNKRLNVLSIEDLKHYQTIPIIKNVHTIRNYQDLENFNTKQVLPYTIDLNEEDVMSWKKIINFDQSKIFGVEIDNHLVAGAIIITNSSEVNMLKIVPNSACLWDIRVEKAYQGKGLGKLLFNACVAFAKAQGKSSIIIETQNNNVDAIKFYESLGAKLYKINYNHYDDLDEDQLLFLYHLGGHHGV